MPIPTAPTITAGSATSFCSGESVVLTSDATIGNQWYKNGISLSGAVATSYSATTAGSYSVKTTTNGCESGFSNTINVSVTAIEPPVPAFSFDAYCINLPVNFSNTSTIINSGTVTWEWNFGDNTTSASQFPSHTYLQPGPYDVTLKITPDQCPLSFRTITKKIVIEKPLAGLRYLNVNTLVNQPKQLAARNFGIGYLWLPPAGLNDNTSVNPVFTGNSNKEYSIRIKAPSGCETVDTLKVNVFTRSGIFIPTAFTPNADGLNDVLRPVLIDISELKNFYVFNRWGYKIFETTNPSLGWDGTSKGVKQPMGIYIVIVEGRDSHGSVISKKEAVTLIR